MQSDGSILFDSNNEALTGNTQFDVCNKPFYLEAGTYFLSAGTNVPANCYWSLKYPSDHWVDVTNGASYTSFTFSERTLVELVRLYVRSGEVVDHLLIKPMIKTAADYAADPSYEPYWECLRDGKLDIADNIVLGAANFLKPILTSATTVNGVTFTPNADGSVKANGTASADIYISTHEVTITNGGYFYLSGCPAGGSDGTYRGKISDNTNDYIFDKGGYNGGSVPNNAGRLTYQIKIWSGQQVSNIVFYPMLALKPMPYVPFAMTNRELTTFLGRPTASRSVNNGSSVSIDLAIGGGFTAVLYAGRFTGSVLDNSDYQICFIGGQSGSNPKISKIIGSSSNSFALSASTVGNRFRFTLTANSGTAWYSLHAYKMPILYGNNGYDEY